ncbi:MAG TPA: phosphoadenylyl-sulfate reductase, partial [Gammaproteobacteria bacterium]|nr:phosphoadenylyl-sulfate reductase [Gammaproteobacteria bacterium]
MTTTSLETDPNIDALVNDLNQRYHDLTPEERVKQLYQDFTQNEVMLTSSFAANSAFLLHLFSKIAHQQKVYFIDTGFHFIDTLEYKSKLARLYDLKVEDVHPEEWKHDFTVSDKTWKTDPDFCCSINKVEP